MMVCLLCKADIFVEVGNDIGESVHRSNRKWGVYLNSDVDGCFSRNVRFLDCFTASIRLLYPVSISVLHGHATLLYIATFFWISVHSASADTVLFVATRSRTFGRLERLAKADSGCESKRGKRQSSHHYLLH